MSLFNHSTNSSSVFSNVVLAGSLALGTGLVCYGVNRFRAMFGSESSRGNATKGAECGKYMAALGGGVVVLSGVVSSCVLGNVARCPRHSLHMASSSASL